MYSKTFRSSYCYLHFDSCVKCVLGLERSVQSVIKNKTEITV